MGAVSAVPRWLQGAWRREGLARGDEPLVEQSDVLWLQTSTYFADLRIPGDPVARELDELDEAQAFSGVGSFVPPRFTWTHDIDTRRRPRSPDTAVLDGQSALLLERGEGYVERWRREAESASVGVLEWYRGITKLRRWPAPAARIVVVGHLAVGVWRSPSRAAAAFERTPAGWSMTATLGKIAQKPERLRELLRGLDEEEDLAAGWIRRDDRQGGT